MKRIHMTEEERQAFFSELSEKIRKLCSPCQIIVFGSFASGEIRESSDLDVCLLFRTEEKVKQAKDAIYSQLPLMGIATDYLFMTQARFDERKDFGGVCVEIAEKGVTLFKENKE